MCQHPIGLAPRVHATYHSQHATSVALQDTRTVHIEYGFSLTGSFFLVWVLMPPFQCVDTFPIQVNVHTINEANLDCIPPREHVTGTGSLVSKLDRYIVPTMFEVAFGILHCDRVNSGPKSVINLSIL